MTGSQRLAQLGTATVGEAAGGGVIDLDLIQVVPGSRVSGPARTVLCAQGDNLMVHAAMKSVEVGEILVLTTPRPEPVALFGELLATQATAHGVAGVLVDGAVRDLEELARLGLPVWGRWTRVTGPRKDRWGAIGGPVTVGGVEIRHGDQLVLDRDGAVVVARERVEEVRRAAEVRAEQEVAKRRLYSSGVLSIDRLELPPGGPGQGPPP